MCEARRLAIVISSPWISAESQSITFRKCCGQAAVILTAPSLVSGAAVHRCRGDDVDADSALNAAAG